MTAATTAAAAAAANGAVGLALLSVLFTGFAVYFGYEAFRLSGLSMARNGFEIGPRLTSLTQADEYHVRADRDRKRRNATGNTFISGAWWIAASLTGASASTSGKAQGVFLVAAAIMFVVAITTTVVYGVLESRAKNRAFKRECVLRREHERSIKKERSAITVEEQLAEWAGIAELIVFVQFSVGNVLRTTYRGKLVQMGAGWGIYPADWHLGPVDSVSPLRGIALNLSAFESQRWQPGNGIYGARCVFFQRHSDGGESLVITDTDPFEVTGPYAQDPTTV